MLEYNDDMGSNSFCQWLKGFLSFLTLSFIMIIIRGETLISGALINPDEAELLALGRRASINLRDPVGTFAVQTLGPIQPTLLGFVGALGIPLTLTTAHIISGLIYVWLCWFGWFRISQKIGWIKGSIFIYPTSIIIFSLDGDFLSLGTELIPLTMISIGILLSFPSIGDVSPNRFLWGSILLGAAPWAKPQSFILAFFIFFLALLRSRRIDIVSTSTLRTKIRLFFFFIPSLFFILYLGLWNSLDEFINETVLFQWNYIFNRNPFFGDPQSFSERVSEFSKFILGHPGALLWALVGSIVIYENHSEVNTKIIDHSHFSWLSVVISTLVTLLILSPIFGHYANYLYAGLLFASVIIMANTNHPLSRSRSSTVTINPITLSLFKIALVVSILSVWPKVLANIENFPDKRYSSPAISPLLVSLCPKHAMVSVWGWSPEFYSWYDWIPSTRYTSTVWQIWPSDKQEYYRQVYLTELNENHPSCILDTASPSFFGNFSQETTLPNVIPQLKPFLDKCYIPSFVTLPDERVVQVWVNSEVCSIGNTST
jgi:hypothetical protein